MTGSPAWRALRRAVERAWRWSRERHVERRTAAARARFWDQVHEGEREASARTDR